MVGWVQWLAPVIPAAWEAEMGRSFEARPSKKVSETTILVKETGCWGVTLSSLLRKVRRIVAQAWQKEDILSQNQSKKGWTCGSSGRVPAQHVQVPEFKLQCSQNNKNPRRTRIWRYTRIFTR
jgi:hypothetical protein